MEYNEVNGDHAVHFEFSILSRCPLLRVSIELNKVPLYKLKLQVLYYRYIASITCNNTTIY